MYWHSEKEGKERCRYRLCLDSVFEYVKYFSAPRYRFVPFLANFWLVFKWIFDVINRKGPRTRWRALSRSLSTTSRRCGGRHDRVGRWFCCCCCCCWWFWCHRSPILRVSSSSVLALVTLEEGGAVVTAMPPGASGSGERAERPFSVSVESMGPSAPRLTGFDR